MKLLLVEDDRELALATQNLLERNKFVVDLADCLGVAKAAILDNQYALMLIDRRLPDGDGTELISFAQRKNVNSRFLVVSALAELEQRIEGLDLGADDYIVKPYEPEELMARIRAALRRPIPDADKTITIDNLTLNCETREFYIDSVPFVLPRREWIILELMVTRTGRVVTRDDFESALYGFDDEFESNTLASHVSRLRKNLKDHGAKVEINVIRGVGYYIKGAG